MAGWQFVPSDFRSFGLVAVLRSDVFFLWLEDPLVLMAYARIEVSEDLHRALEIQATKADMTTNEYVTYLLFPLVDKETWDFLGIERPIDDPEALEKMRRFWEDKSPLVDQSTWDFLGIKRTTSGAKKLN